MKFSLTILVFLAMSCLANLQAQQEVTWSDLSDVQFTPDYVDSLELSYLFPEFGEIPQELEGKEIELEGYFIPVNEDTGFYVLSQKPNASCYFCGAAGPETIVEIWLSAKERKRVKMDDRIKVGGRFRTNDTDLNHCNYILEDAKLIDI